MGLSKKHRVYLAGPMTGYEYYNSDEFYRMEELILKATDNFFDVVNPARLDREEGFDHRLDKVTNGLMRQFLRRNMFEISHCDALYLMKGWENSKGCLQEISSADMIDIPVFEIIRDPSHCGGWIREVCDVEISNAITSYWQKRAHPAIVEAPAPKQESILEEAMRITSQDRNLDYGPPTEDFKRQSDVLNAYYAHKLKEGEKFQPHDMAIIQMLVKLCRMIVSPVKRDHWVDEAGYADCGWKCVVEFLLGKR